MPLVASMHPDQEQRFGAGGHVVKPPHMLHLNFSAILFHVFFLKNGGSDIK